MTDALLIQKPWITEKATALSESGKYVFIVKPAATKNEVKKAIREIYKVDVVAVRMIRTTGKPRRFRGVLGKTPDRKKAVVTVKAGQKIDLGK